MENLNKAVISYSTINWNLYLYTISKINIFRIGE